MGRYLEAEELLKETEKDEVKDEDNVRPFLDKVMPSLRNIAVRARLPTEKEGYTKLDLPEHHMVIYVRRAETIDVCFSTDLPATWEKMLAMNWEADLSSQWLPFSPEVVTTYSEKASMLMLYVHAKVPPMPGSREAYIHRHVVDLFTPNSVLDGRQGLLIVEKSPDNWKTGSNVPPSAQMKLLWDNPRSATSDDCSWTDVGHKGFVIALWALFNWDGQKTPGIGASGTSLVTFINSTNGPQCSNADSCTYRASSFDSNIIFNDGLAENLVLFQRAGVVAICYCGVLDSNGNCLREGSVSS
eukprot:symbB.v1.2.029610.t1/scaffold3265.1/size60019/2